MRYRRTTEVTATPETVWSVLVDVERWPEWTRSVDRITPAGALALGTTARVEQPHLPATEWVVTAFEPGRRFAWTSSRAGVTTVADHVLAGGPGARTSVTLSIEMRGALAFLAGLVSGRLVRRYVDMEADGLARRCEGG